MEEWEKKLRATHNIFVENATRKNPFHSITTNGINAYKKQLMESHTHSQRENILYRALALLLSPFFVLARACTRSFFLYHHRCFSSAHRVDAVAFSLTRSLSVPFVPLFALMGGKCECTSSTMLSSNILPNCFECAMCVFSWKYTHTYANTDYFIHHILLFSFDFRIFVFGCCYSLSPFLSYSHSFYSICQPNVNRIKCAHFGMRISVESFCFSFCWCHYWLVLPHIRSTIFRFTVTKGPRHPPPVRI